MVVVLLMVRVVKGSQCRNREGGAVHARLSSSSSRRGLLMSQILTSNSSRSSQWWNGGDGDVHARLSSSRSSRRSSNLPWVQTPTPNRKRLKRKRLNCKTFSNRR
jgi:hypothetical protein